MQVQSNQATVPDNTPNPENTPIPEESLNSNTQKRTPNQQNLPLDNKHLQPLIFPYTHTDQPTPLTEGTGLYSSPFYAHPVNTSAHDSQASPLFFHQNRNHTLSPTPQDQSRHSLAAPQHVQPLLQSHSLLRVSEHCNDAAIPIAVTDTGPVFIDSTPVNKENDALHHGTTNDDLFRSVSFGSSHQPFCNPADRHQNIVQGLPTDRDNAFGDSQEPSAEGQESVFVDTANAIHETMNRSDDPHNLFQGSSGIHETEPGDTSHSRDILCGAMSNAEENKNIALGNMNTQATKEVINEIHVTHIDADDLGGEEVVSEEAKRDSTKTTKNSSLNHEEEEVRATNSFQGNKNDRTTPAKVVLDTTKALHSTDLHGDMVRSVAQQIEKPLEITEGKHQAKFPGSEMANIDDGNTKPASATPSNVRSFENSEQTFLGCRESSAIRLPPLDFLTASSPQLTTTNTLAPITGGSVDLFNQDCTYSIPTRKEQNHSALFNFPVFKSKMQPPIPEIAPHVYGNPSSHTRRHLLNSATEQQLNLSCRPRINSVDNVPLFDSNTGLQFSCVDEGRSTLPGSSSISSIQQSHDLHTFETPVQVQNSYHQGTDSTDQFSIVPMRGRPAHRHPYLHRPSLSCVHTSNASQVYSKQSTVVPPLNPFGTIPSNFGAHHELSHNPTSTYSAEKGTREIPQQSHQIPSPCASRAFSDESRARVIEHPPMRNLNGSICPYCNKPFKTEKDKQRHVQRMHLLKGRYPCSYAPCKQSFAEAHKLSRHVRTVHLMNRPFKCPHCESAFGERGNMMQHMRKSHLGLGKDAKRSRRN